MKRFRFALQPVAVLRAHRELRAKEVFAAAAQAYRRAEQELADTRARVAAVEAALAARRQQRFTAQQEAEALASYREECATEVKAEAAVTAARNAMQQRRAEYIDAHRQVEVVQRLEQKARLAHRLDANREEQAGYDDFASRRFVSRRSLLTS